MRIGIIGAGMAGLSCAHALRGPGRGPGHDPVVFDKGRGPGGGMVVQADADWSRDTLEREPATVERALLAAFAAAVKADLPVVIATSVHRWRHAKSGASGIEARWNADLRLGVCGDWLPGSRIEAAWLSGQRPAARIGRA